MRVICEKGFNDKWTDGRANVSSGVKGERAVIKTPGSERKSTRVLSDLCFAAERRHPSTKSPFSHRT